VKNMSASASGRGRAAKAGLNKSILDHGWAEFRRQLDYKLVAAGDELIAVNPAYSSRTCRLCQHESSENRKSQALFACVACGHTEHADRHAAKVILQRGIEAFEARQAISKAAGHAASACGEVVRHAAAAKQPGAASVKQEPTEAFRLAQETGHV
jgi:putative transposase